MTKLPAGWLPRNRDHLQAQLLNWIWDYLTSFTTNVRLVQCHYTVGWVVGLARNSVIEVNYCVWICKCATMCLKGCKRSHEAQHVCQVSREQSGHEPTHGKDDVRLARPSNCFTVSLRSLCCVQSLWQLAGRSLHRWVMFNIGHLPVVHVTRIQPFLPHDAAMLSVRLSVTRVLFDKPNNALQLFWYRTKGQSL